MNKFVQKFINIFLFIFQTQTNRAVQFEAYGVEVENTDFDILAITFHREDENYLMIQQSQEHDEELGMNTYHIERDDQSYGGYGGVKKVTLHKNSAEFVLDATGKENLDCEKVIVDFDIDKETFEQLEEALQKIFGAAFSTKK